MATNPTTMPAMTPPDSGSTCSAVVFFVVGCVEEDADETVVEVAAVVCKQTHIVLLMLYKDRLLPNLKHSRDPSAA